MTSCKFNLNDTTTALGEQLRAVFPFPEVLRTLTPAGRTAVSDFVMNVVTSDAALHAVRGDLKRSGTTVDATTNFADAFGNLGNMISAQQQESTAKVISPMLDVATEMLDTLGITDTAKRKELLVNVGRYRDALHSVERHKIFRLLKTPYRKGYSDEAKANIDNGKADLAAGKITEEQFKAIKNANKPSDSTKGERDRKQANEDFLSGKLTREQFLDRLQELADTYKIDERLAATISGMDITHATNAVAALEQTPHVKAVYAGMKPHIDNIFSHVIDLNKRAGRLSEDSLKYLQFYQFEHYSPAYSAEQVDSLNESSTDNIGVDTLRVAEGGLVKDRIPFFAAAHVQLNAAARALAENNAIEKLHKFASAENTLGFKVSEGEDIYGVTDTGHSMARLKYPSYSLPYCKDGKVSWINVNAKGLTADEQLFKSMKNRLTQNFNTSKSSVDSTLQRYMTNAPARLFTNLNPSFWFNSAVRDPLHVLTNVLIDPRIEDKGTVVKRVAGLMTGAFNHKAALTHYLGYDAEHRGSDPSEFGYWAHRLAVNGGETVFAKSFYSQDYIDGSQTEMPYNLGGSVSSLQGAVAKGGDVGHLILNKTADLVTAFDMQARTAVFRALVESGQADEQTAAAIVREFMDFSQKGLQHNTLLTLIPFFRTSAVAAHRLATTLLYNDKGEFAPQLEPIAAMIAMGFMWGMASAGDKDEDGISSGDKIANAKYFGNLTVWYDADGNARSIPLPYGAPSIFVGLGSAIYRATNGIQAPSDVFSSYALHAAKNLLPIPTQDLASPDAGADDSILSALSNLNPVLGQVNQLVGGKDSFGRDIYADNTFSEGATQALEGKVTTPDMYKDMAYFLYEHAGVDMYPETIQALLKNWTPLGLGKSLDSTMRNSMEIVSGDTSSDTGILSSMINGAYLDKTPSMFNYQQYRKAIALDNDIKRRLADPELADTVTPAMQDYSNALAPYVSQINGISSTMRNAPEEYKPALRAEKQRLAALAGRVAVHYRGN